MQIRNIAIIAHVDHGKTTLVDAMLKQTHTFRDNQKEMSQTLIMDSNDLEREKGITILAKNTSVFYKDTKIDKKDARPDEVKREVENLFLSLAHDESALHFETIYSVGRDGKAFLVLPEKYSSETKGDLSPLFETILEQVPDAHNENDEPSQMLISTLDRK